MGDVAQEASAAGGGCEIGIWGDGEGWDEIGMGRYVRVVRVSIAIGVAETVARMARREMMVVWENIFAGWLGRGVVGGC